MAELERASQRTQDLQSFGEADRLEFMYKGVAEQALDLDQAGSWEIIHQGMIMQKVFANDAYIFFFFFYIQITPHPPNGMAGGPLVA